VGLIKLREEDVTLASSTAFLDKDLADFGKNSGAMLEDCFAWAKDNGFAIKQKSSHFGGRLSKMSTTYYKEIRVGARWTEFSVPKRAAVLKHEIVHARQWRHYGQGSFATKYIFSARFRWAVEVQAYRESIRVYRTLGAVEKWLREYVKDLVPNSLWKNYALKTLRKDDVYDEARRILSKEIP
jgi:hypothetical protein